MTVTEMVNEMTEILNEFENMLAVQGISDENVEETLMLSRRKISKVNPEMVNTARAELGTVKRWMLEMAADAVYATGGDYEAAEAGKAEMEIRLDSVS